MTHSQDLNKEMMFYSAWHAQNLANTIVHEIEESVALECQKIDDIAGQLLQTVPEHILNMTGEQLVQSNFDLSLLLGKSCKNPDRHGYFDEERCAQVSSLAGSQVFDHKVNQAKKLRWKTPTKKQLDSASKGKGSSKKKGSVLFKGNKHQISSGKKLTWKC